MGVDDSNEPSASNKKSGFGDMVGWRKKRSETYWLL